MIEDGSLPSNATILVSETAEQVNSKFNSWMYGDSHYAGSWRTADRTFYYCGVATMIADSKPSDNTKGQEGSFYININGSYTMTGSGRNMKATSCERIFKKNNGKWTNVFSGEYLDDDNNWYQGTSLLPPGAWINISTRSDTNDRPFEDNSTPIGTLFLNANNSLYEAIDVNGSRKMRIADDFPNDETYNGGKWSPARNYWTVDSSGNYILFKKQTGFVPHQQLRYYLYNNPTSGSL